MKLKDVIRYFVSSVLIIIISVGVYVLLNYPAV